MDKIQQAIDSSEDPDAKLHINGETKGLPIWFNFVSTPKNQIWNWFLKLDKEAKVLKPKTSKGIGLSRKPEYATTRKTHVSFLELQQIVSNDTYGVADWQKALCTVRDTSNARKHLFKFKDSNSEVKEFLKSKKVEKVVSSVLVKLALLTIY